MIEGLKLHTKSRDGLYEANAIYADGLVVVHSGSRINIKPGQKYTPSEKIELLIEDSSIVNSEGILLKNVEFKSLSAAASFVQGRSANGMISWKTEDGKYVRESLQ